MKLLLRYFVCGLTLVCLVTASLWGAKQLFSLSIATPSEPVKSGVELRLSVTVTNTSDRTIGFIRSPGLLPEEGYRYEIEVRDAGGHPAPSSAHMRDLKNKTTATFESNVARWLKPGESFVDEIDVTKFYDLSQPGKYTISVARPIPPAQNLGEGKVKSNSITVTVVQ